MESVLGDGFAIRTKIKLIVNGCLAVGFKLAKFESIRATIDSKV